jgi:hypothetical protein
MPSIPQIAYLLLFLSGLALVTNLPHALARDSGTARKVERSGIHVHHSKSTHVVDPASLACRHSCIERALQSPVFDYDACVLRDECPGQGYTCTPGSPPPPGAGIPCDSLIKYCQGKVARDGLTDSGMDYQECLIFLGANNC